MFLLYILQTRRNWVSVTLLRITEESHLRVGLNLYPRTSGDAALESRLLRLEA